MTIGGHDFFYAEICGVCYKAGIYILLYDVSFLGLYIIKRRNTFLMFLCRLYIIKT